MRLELCETKTETETKQCETETSPAKSTAFESNTNWCFIFVTHVK